jgi:hypothetical protein
MSFSRAEPNVQQAVTSCSLSKCFNLLQLYDELIPTGLGLVHTSFSSFLPACACFGASSQLVIRRKTAQAATLSGEGCHASDATFGVSNFAHLWGADMGMGIRVFVVEDNDQVKRLPLGLFNSLINREPTARIPAYAGRRMRYVLVFLDVADRRPVDVRRVDCNYLQFDDAGRLDEDAERAEMGAAVQAIDFGMQPARTKSVVQARHLFARRAYEYQYKWKPTEAVLKQVQRAIFGV